MPCQPEDRDLQLAAPDHRGQICRETVQAGPFEPARKQRQSRFGGKANTRFGSQWSGERDPFRAEPIPARTIATVFLSKDLGLNDKQAGYSTPSCEAG